MWLGKRTVRLRAISKKLLMILAASLISTSSYAAFSLEATRVIYPEWEKSASVGVSATGDINYLVQSWVETQDNQQTIDFLTVPPLFKLNGDEKNNIQIIKSAALPHDRESLYWMNVKFVPPSRKSDENLLRYSVTNKIKLIYRPVNLKDVDLTQELEKLQFQIKGQDLQITNPSPVYINTNALSVNKQPLENPGFLAPHSTRTIKLKSVPTGKVSIELNYINDFGLGLDKTFEL